MKQYAIFRRLKGLEVTWEFRGRSTGRTPTKKHMVKLRQLQKDYDFVVFELKQVYL